MELLLARSIAGHDKGQVYVVLSENDADVILINGKNRTLTIPKRKRRKHVQLIRHLPGELTGEAAALERWTDEGARKLIRMYLKEDSKIV
ncbi:MAG: RNA-binding protein [Lachnospiraceae bacterium]|nr:RNA-binding protein [Lachnospiraceae bacterium]